MKRISSRIGPNGQLILPREIQDHLQLYSGTRVIFEIDGDDIRLLADRWTLEAAHASIPPLAEALDDAELDRRVKEDRAANLVREMASQ